MALSETWEQLSTAALLGTGRAGGVPALEDPLAGAAGSGRTAEEALLSAIATMDVYRRAGAMAESGEAAGAGAAAAEHLPTVSRRAAQQLRQIVTGDFQALLPEFLAVCAEQRKRVPATMLVELLDYAAKEKSIVPLLGPVIGERGVWLRGQNEAWKNLDATPDAAEFETGGRAARLAYVKHLRERDPGAARALLEKSWPQETPEDRSAFIALLAEKLSNEDEPFLEAALDDKRKEVRTAAAEMLAGLPESRLAQRMLARVTPLVALKKKIIEITLPSELSKEMQRDGMTAKPSRSTLGEKAWWLAQMVGATPLSYWKGEPDDVIGAAFKSEFAQALVYGLAAAAARQRNAPWSEAAITRLAATGGEELVEEAGYVPRLLKSMTPADVEALALAGMETSKGKKNWEGRNYLLFVMTHGWSLEFSKKVVGHLAAELKGAKDTQHEYALAAIFQKDIALYIHPGVAAEVAALLPKERSDWLTRAMEKFAAIVQFRHDMLKELKT